MGSGTDKANRRALRRAFGNDAVKYIENQNTALQAIAGVLLGRSFWGRLRWLLFGK